MIDNSAGMIRCSANAVQVYDTGVLITGSSGAGKSHLTKQLISRGHFFIADDAVDLYCDNNVLWAQCPKSIEGLIYLRAMGIIPVTQLVSNKQILKKTQIKLKIELLNEQQTDYSIAIMYQTASKFVSRCGISIRRFSSRNRRVTAKMIENAVNSIRMRDNSTNKPLSL